MADNGAAEALDWGAPLPQGGPSPHDHDMLADAAIADDDDDDDANGQQDYMQQRSSTDGGNGKSVTMSSRRGTDPAAAAAPPPLQPLWLVASVQAADEELAWEALSATQLRSHALTSPSTATFKDAARFVAFLAVETGGMPRAPRGAGLSLPGAPLIQMAVRTMQDRPELTVRVRTLFDTLSRWRPPSTTTAAAATSNAKLIRASAFRHFFVEALRVVSQGTLDPQLAGQVADCEWRAARSHSSVAGALALKAARKADAGLSAAPSSSASAGAPGIPLAAFTDKLLHFLALFVSNGGAFAAPLERHATRLLSYVCVCVLQLDVNAATGGPAGGSVDGHHRAPLGATRPTGMHHYHHHEEEEDNRDPLDDATAAAGSLVPRPPSPPQRSGDGGVAPDGTRGFLPPARPWTHARGQGQAQAAAVAASSYAQSVAGNRPLASSFGKTAQRSAATAPQLRQVSSSVGPGNGGGGGGGGRLPLILTKRHVDDFAAPDDLADGTVSIGVGSFAGGGGGGLSSAAGSARGLSGSSLYTSKLSTDAAAMRKALRVFELYAHHGPPPGPSSGALVQYAPDASYQPYHGGSTTSVAYGGSGAVLVRVSQEPAPRPRNAGRGPQLNTADQRRGRGKAAQRADWRTGSMAMHGANKNGDPRADAGLISGASMPSQRRPRDAEVAKAVLVEGLGLV